MFTMKIGDLLAKFFFQSSLVFALSTVCGRLIVNLRLLIFSFSSFWFDFFLFLISLFLRFSDLFQHLTAFISINLDANEILSINCKWFFALIFLFPEKLSDWNRFFLLLFVSLVCGAICTEKFTTTDIHFLSMSLKWIETRAQNVVCSHPKFYLRSPFLVVIAKIF